MSFSEIRKAAAEAVRPRCIAFAVGSPGVEISRVTVHLDALNRYKGTKLTLSTV
jgi:hypothetical protein